MKSRPQESSEAASAFHALIYGAVQGVGFRYRTVNQARHLGLTGYVRNLPDGSVEVLAEGPRQDLDRLLRWLKQGPPAAAVRSVSHRLLPPSGSCRGFTVRF